MKALIVIGGAILIVPAPAAAADWYRVGLTDASVTYADTGSAVRTGDKVTAWVNRIWFKPASSGLRQAKVRYEITCSSRSYISRYMISYSADGSSDSWTPTYRVEYAAPETVMESTIVFLCGDPSFGIRVQDAEADARQISPK